MKRDSEALSDVRNPPEMASTFIRADPSTAVSAAEFTWCQGTVAALREFLITSRLETRLDESVLPTPKAFLLYGRKGSGKSSVIHCGQYNASALRHERVFIDRAFAEVHNFKVRDWNLQKFEEWCNGVTAALEKKAAQQQQHHHPERDLSSVLVMIGNVHILGECRTEAPSGALKRLLTTVRLCTSLDIRVIATCDKHPGHVDESLRELFDIFHMMPLPGASARVDIAYRSMLHFQSYVYANSSPVKDVTWEVSTSDEDLKNDPDHPFRAFAINSTGCTPREIVDFMQRTYRICVSMTPPREYTEERFEQAYFTVDGNKTITAYNPYAKNQLIIAYGAAEAPPQPDRKSAYVIGQSKTSFIPGDVEKLAAEREENLQNAASVTSKRRRKD